jgi:hypothetical protein
MDVCGSATRIVPVAVAVIVAVRAREQTCFMEIGSKGAPLSTATKVKSAAHAFWTIIRVSGHSHERSTALFPSVRTIETTLVVSAQKTTGTLRDGATSNWSAFPRARPVAAAVAPSSELCTSSLVE